MSIAMQTLIYFAYYLIGAVEIAMTVRAVLSWIMPDMSGPLANFLYAITEPFIAVMRRLFDKLNWEGNGFLDIPFFATYFLLAILQAVFRAML